VPVNNGRFRTAALVAENLEETAVRVKDEASPGVLILRMPSSYVYLTGELTLTAAIGQEGSIVVSYSENNGINWRDIGRVTAAGSQRFDALVLRRYDYRLKFEFHGKGTGLDVLKIVHDVQHSQRALPALTQGRNTITFSAGPPEGTITVEGAVNTASKGKQIVYTAFNPEVDGFDKTLFVGSTGKGSITFPVTTPGDIVRLRFGTHYRARDTRDGIDYHVSFDQGKSWTLVDRAAGPTVGDCKYVRFEQVPPGSRAALVRFSGTSRNATGIFNFRIDADYSEPSGGYRPVKVTYTWHEDGKENRHVHTARRQNETYTIECRTRPVMKAIALELAE
jgi:hypothetical protein